MAFVSTNNLDDIAIYLGITRLNGEIDSDFASRIKRLAKIGYGINYNTSVSNICEQIGLSKSPALRIESSVPYTVEVKEDKILLTTFPASGTSKFYSVFINIPVTLDSNGSVISSPLKKFIDVISTDSDFAITIIDSDYLKLPREHIFKNRNFSFSQQVIYNRRSIVNAKNVLYGSMSSDSSLMVSSVSDLQSIQKGTDYYFDYTTNYLELGSDSFSPFAISYTDYSNIFVIYKTQFNITSVYNYMQYGMSDNVASILRSILSTKSIGL